MGIIQQSPIRSSNRQGLKKRSTLKVIHPGTYLPGIFQMQPLARIFLCTDAVNPPSASAQCLRLPVATPMPEAQTDSAGTGYQHGELVENVEAETGPATKLPWYLLLLWLLLMPSNLLRPPSPWSCARLSCSGTLLPSSPSSTES